MNRQSRHTTVEERCVTQPVKKETKQFNCRLFIAYMYGSFFSLIFTFYLSLSLSPPPLPPSLPLSLSLSLSLSPSPPPSLSLSLSPPPLSLSLSLSLCPIKTFLADIF